MIDVQSIHYNGVLLDMCGKKTVYYFLVKQNPNTGQPLGDGFIFQI